MSMESCNNNLQSKPSKAICTLHPIGLLGTGSFGRVIVARCPETKTSHVVKIIKLDPPPGYTIETYWKQLRGEVQMLSLNSVTRSPFLLYLKASFVSGNQLCLVMPYIKDGNLEDIVLQQNEYRLPSELARFYCAEIVAGVGFLHNRGVIHCDLKPSNILVNSNGHIVICDFGLAVDAAFCCDRIGTPAYSPIEKLRGLGFDASSDWWSVALCLHFMLYGLNPAWHYECSFKENVEYLAATKMLPLSKPLQRGDHLANSFMQAILVREPEERLGYGEFGYKNLLAHPYMRDYDTSKLERGLLEPPCKLNTKSTGNVFKRIYSPDRAPLRCCIPSDERERLFFRYFSIF